MLAPQVLDVAEDVGRCLRRRVVKDQQHRRTLATPQMDRLVSGKLRRDKVRRG